MEQTVGIAHTGESIETVAKVSASLGLGGLDRPAVDNVLNVLNALPMSMQKPRPFVEHVGIDVTEQRDGFSTCVLSVAPHHFNSSGVVHGGAIFTLADTGMGAALIDGLQEGEWCATIDITINYLKPVLAGTLTCSTEVINRGKSVAHLESHVHSSGVLVAKASGNYAIFKPGK
jgi:acyl-CoA thioesterase